MFFVGGDLLNSPYADELKLIDEICDTIHVRYPSMAIAKIPNERRPVPPKTKLGAPDIYVGTRSESVFPAVVLSGILTEELCLDGKHERGRAIEANSYR